MPTVPLYGNRNIAPAALPGVRKQAGETALSEGAGVAEAQGQQGAALERLGAIGAHIATSEYADMVQKEKDRADSIAVLNAGNRLSSWSNARLYDPNTGALNVKGKDAMGLPEQVLGEFTDTANEIAQGLSNERQRDAFLRTRLDAQQNIDHTVRSHVLNEINTYEATELKGAVVNSTNAAIQNATDPRRVGEELGKITDAIKTHGPNLGMGPEQVQSQVDQARSGVHVGVIDRLLSLDQEKAAGIYFDETKSQIDGDAQTRITKALEEASTRRAGQQQADKIIAAGGTLTEQRDQARQIDDPKVRDEVMARIEHESAVKDKTDRDAQESTLITAYNTVDKTKDVTAIPTDVWTKLDGGARSSLRSYASQLARGVAIETDTPTLYGLMTMAGSDRETFAKTNLLQYKAKLSEADFKFLAERQLEIRTGDGKKADTELAGFLTHKELVDSTLSRYGIETSEAKQTADEKKAVAQLLGMVDRRVASEQSLTGKKASNDDIQRVLDDLLSKSITVPGSWWNIWPGGQPFFDESKRVLDIKVGDIPPSERPLIEQALRKVGRTPTDANVLDLYIETNARKRQ